MSNFNWNQFSDDSYQAKVGEFVAYVWFFPGYKHCPEGWKFSFAGTTDPLAYQTAEIAKAACEVRGIHWIVSACNALGYTVRTPKE